MSGARLPFPQWVGRVISQESPTEGLSLDIGCAAGDYHEFFRNTVIGVDLRREPGARAIASATDLPVVADSMDFVTAFQCLDCIPDAPRAVAEIGRVLRPGAHAVVSVCGFPRLVTHLLGDHSLPHLRRRGQWERIFGRAGFSVARIEPPPRGPGRRLLGCVERAQAYRFFRLTRSGGEEGASVEEKTSQ